MILNSIVDFELAKLLTEKEYPQKTKSYNEEGKLVNVSLSIRKFNPEKNYYPAPTIGQVIDWIYEKSGIWISIDMVYSENQTGFWYTISESKDNDTYIQSEGFDSPTEAYTQAITYTLKNLI